MDPAVRDAELREALAVYVGSLAIDARVALFGDASLGLGDRLLEAGARAVHVWDPDRERATAAAARSPRGLHVQHYPPSEAALRAADLVLVVDLGLFDDPGEVVAFARAMTGDTGVALIRGQNRETTPEATRAFDYYELFDWVAGPFSTVRMLAQLTFDGVALVALGEESDEPPAVSVDTQLADSDRSVAAFVAVASEREIALEPYSIIELPPREGEGSSERWSTELSEARGLADALERRLEDQTAHCADLEVKLAARSERLSSLAAEVDALRGAVDAGAISASEAEDLTRRAEHAGALAERVDRAEHRAATLERDLALSAEAHVAEIVRLEGALRERAQAARSLEIELARRDEIVRELVSSLGETGGAGPTGSPGRSEIPEAVAVERGSPVAPEQEPPSATIGQGAAAPVADSNEGEPEALFEENVRLRQQLDTLALDLARREAEAQGAAWTVAELERQLAQRTQVREEARAGGSGDASIALSQALDEVDALRRALAQEHATRIRLESGAELAQARNEIEQLTVLLEQQASAQRAVTDPGTGRSGEPVPPLP
ncbi:MAG TPA: hypothetical protein VEK07_25575 [Polyangiaceae bacterium]|nr:hypothetical protein [Polyangiaceae bacterium]